MSETDVTSAETADVDTDAPDAGEQTAPKPTETVDFWKSKAREQEKRAKENAAAAKRLAEIEEASKTAEQKAAERLAAAEQRALELELKATRAEVSSSTGVPVDILAGPEDSTPEALTAYAERVLEFTGRPSVNRVPKVDPIQGWAPNVTDRDSQARQILGF